MARPPFLHPNTPHLLPPLSLNDRRPLLAPPPPPPNHPRAGSKVPPSYWGKSSGEGGFTFHKGQLVAGCFDKAQFGKFGLLHAMQVGGRAGWPAAWATVT
jgi:hypothetical protein